MAFGIRRANAISLQDLQRMCSSIHQSLQTDRQTYVRHATQDRALHYRPIVHRAVKTSRGREREFLPRDASAERGDATVSCPSVRL